MGRMSLDHAALIRLGQEVLGHEEEGLRSLRPLLNDPAYARAVEVLLACRGRVLVSGVGKSGIVAMRIAASFRSTATPAWFLHPVEAVHGDLGLADPADVALLLSRSGESAELLRLLPSFERLAIPVISVTAQAGSQLARAADVSLVVGPLREAGPLTLVPSTSVTVFEVLGDLLVTALYVARGITERELAWLHPGGLIGQKVLTRVEEAMHVGPAMPKISEEASLRDGILEVMAKKLGMTTVVDGGGRLTGVLTDGDLRRVVHLHGGIDPFRVKEVMTRNPRTIDRHALLAAAVARMENNQPGPITSLVVVDAEGRPEGVLHLHDCLRLRRPA
jgi:arabinose-5-phosphate isomerase